MACVRGSDSSAFVPASSNESTKKSQPDSLKPKDGLRLRKVKEGPARGKVPVSELSSSGSWVSSSSAIMGRFRRRKVWQDRHRQRWSRKSSVKKRAKGFAGGTGRDDHLHCSVTVSSSATVSTLTRFEDGSGVPGSVERLRLTPAVAVSDSVASGGVVSATVDAEDTGIS